jgi:uncharacterized lipoprotein YbaY
VVKGTVAYREDLTLPPDAVVDVWAVDVTPGMNAAVILAETSVPVSGRQIPIPFEMPLPYDPSRIAPDHDYGVKAVIKTARGEALFETPEAVRVLTKGNPSSVNLMLTRVGAPAAPPSAAGLAGTSWRVEELAGEAVPAGAEGTLDFPESGKIAGRAFCNRFSGKAEIYGSSIRIGKVMD